MVPMPFTLPHLAPPCFLSLPLDQNTSHTKAKSVLFPEAFRPAPS